MKNHWKKSNCKVIVEAENMDPGSHFMQVNQFVPSMNFKGIFSKLIDQVAPLKSVRLKHRSIIWFDGEILNLISRRDKALYKFKKSGSSEDGKEYRVLRNKTQKIIEKRKC